MASDDNQYTNHTTSQGIQSTIILLQIYTERRTPEQPNIIYIQWKLKGRNGIPEGNPPRQWFRILRHHWNQKIFSHHKDKYRVITII